MALYNAPRPRLDPTAAVALGRPPEALGGWLPLIVAAIVSIAIIAVLYSPFGPL
jgi:hypothetical protein